MRPGRCQVAACCSTLLPLCPSFTRRLHQPCLRTYHHMSPSHTSAPRSPTPDPHAARTFSPHALHLPGRFHSHRESVTCCAWLPDSKRFLSGSIDKTVLMTDTDGNELRRWRRPYRCGAVSGHAGRRGRGGCSSRQVTGRRWREAAALEKTLQVWFALWSCSLHWGSSYALAFKSHPPALLPLRPVSIAEVPSCPALLVLYDWWVTASALLPTAPLLPEG